MFVVGLFLCLKLVLAQWFILRNTHLQHIYLGQKVKKND